MPEQPTIDVQSLIEDQLVTDGLWLAESRSTNTFLLEESPFSAEPGLYVLGADKQTAGRGRNAKRWSTSAGALTFSLLLAGKPAPALLPMRVALAVCHSVDGCLPVPSEIKWPNDVMYGEYKLAGILIESCPSLGTVIGVGINVNNRAGTADTAIRNTMTSLADCAGRTVSRELILREFLCHLHQTLVAESELVVQAVRDRNWLADREIVVVDGPNEMERARGRVQTIASDGGLVIEADGALVVVHSGSVRSLADNS